MEGAYVTRQVTGNKLSIDVARRVADLVIAAHFPRPLAGRRTVDDDRVDGARAIYREESLELSTARIISLNQMCKAR